MADVSSRAFKSGEFFSAASNLTSFLNTHFPLPQSACWKMLIIPSKLTLCMMSCLLGKQLTMEQLLRLPGLAKSTGDIGNNMSATGNATPSSLMHYNLKKESFSRLLLQESRQVSTVKELKSTFHQSWKRLRPSPRPANWMDSKVLSTKWAQQTHASF
eukprot:8100258-Ditylum_brightwellii.AAC.1